MIWEIGNAVGSREATPSECRKFRVKLQPGRQAGFPLGTSRRLHLQDGTYAQAIEFNFDADTRSKRLRHR